MRCWGVSGFRERFAHNFLVGSGVVVSSMTEVAQPPQIPEPAVPAPAPAPAPAKPAEPTPTGLKRKAPPEDGGEAAAPTASVSNTAAVGSMFRRSERGVEYDIIETEDGGYKRRRVGSIGKARQWHYFCVHGTRKERCKICGGSSICTC